MSPLLLYQFLTLLFESFKLFKPPDWTTRTKISIWPQIYTCCTDNDHWGAVWLHAAPLPSHNFCMYGTVHAVSLRARARARFFWFLSTHDWQLLNEGSLEHLPCRPSHKPSTYISHTYTDTQPLCIDSQSCPPRLYQGCPWLGSICQSLGDGLRVSIVIEFLWDGFLLSGSCSIKLNTNTLQHLTSLFRPQRWDGIAGKVNTETRGSVPYSFPTLQPSLIHSSSHLCSFSFLQQKRAEPIKILCGWIRWRKTYLLHDILSTPRVVTDLAHPNTGGRNVVAPTMLPLNVDTYVLYIYTLLVNMKVYIKL